MTAEWKSPRALLVVLLSTAFVAFLVGVGLERRSTESGAITTPGEAGETGEPGHREEMPAGFNLESTPARALAIMASIALVVAATAAGRHPAALLAIPVFCLAFAAADGLELVHQLSESRPLLAGAATTVLSLHVAAAFVAALLTRTNPVTEDQATAQA